MTGPNAFLAEFDAMAHEAFVDAGMADVADYAKADGSADGMRRIYVDTAGQTLGEWDQLRGARTAIGVLLADGAVEVGGTLTLGSQSWVLQAIDSKDANDGSVQWWVVR